MSSAAPADNTANEPPEVAEAASAPTGSFWVALFELGKLRLTTMVMVTTGIAFLIPASLSFRGTTLFATMIGTGLLSAAASALNQVWEVRWDRLMNRTRNRPFPAQRLGKPFCLAYAAVTAIAGAALLTTMANPLAAALAFASLVIYVFLYTPMKRLTTLNTVVGAIPGALPVLVGWAAATGKIDPPSIGLFGILFVWQIPHFLAIAWMHKEDYARAGFRMLPVTDASGDRTCRMIIFYSAALILVSLTPVLVGIAGFLYLLGALILGFFFFAVSMRFTRIRTMEAAKDLFVASLIYLPILFALLVIDPGHAIGTP